MLHGVQILLFTSSCVCVLQRVFSKAMVRKPICSLFPPLDDVVMKGKPCSHGTAHWSAEHHGYLSPDLV